jgi:hypothetical protein
MGVQMKKNILVIIFALTMAINAYAQQYDDERDFMIDWDTNVRGGVVITKYKGSKSVVNIPPRIQNLPVTSIGNFAFYYCTGLNRVTIPNSVTRIGDWAFYGCTSLTSINYQGTIASNNMGIFFPCYNNYYNYYNYYNNYYNYYNYYYNYYNYYNYYYGTSYYGTNYYGQFYGDLLGRYLAGR